MFEENENLVLDGTENVEEQATEELVNGMVGEETIDTIENEVTAEPKMYTEEEMNARVNELLAQKLKGKLSSQERKLKRDFEKELKSYKEVESVLNAGLGTSSIEEAKQSLEDFYAKKGITVPKYHDTYNENDTKILANAEADSIIEAGYEEVVEEVNRLADIGADNMTPREKIIFTKLANERQRLDDEKALNSLGINRDAIENSEFKEFAKKLNPTLGLKEKYELYLAQKPKKQIEKMGSMKSGQASKVKDFYTAEEIERMTDEDLDNPAIWEAVRKSMTGQS